MKNYKKGFTLIELLVVIAIIGILSSVVLASLNTARNKGADAAVKSNLANARAQAELFYDSNTQSYAGVCAAPAVAGVKSINASVLAAAQAVGIPSVAANNAAQTATANCNDAVATWVASVPTRSVTGFYCVDSTGQSKSTATALAASATVCP